MLSELTLNRLNLPFLTDKPEEFSFNKDGGIYYSPKFDITVEAPAGVVTGEEEEERIRFTLAVCACGPFAIAEEYKVITAFICVETSSKLHKPVRVRMQHCLKMLKYEKTHSVIILRANYQQTSCGEYIFEPYWGYEIGGNNQKEKRQIVRPEISSELPYLWFEIDEFCILCGVVADTTSKVHSHASPQPTPLKADNVTNPYRNPVTNPGAGLVEMGKIPSLEEEVTIERSGSSASSISAASSVAPAHVSTVAAHPESRLHHPPQERKAATTKRKHSLESTSTSVSDSKRQCLVEYAVLFLYTTNISSTSTYKFYIFVCQNCITSIEVSLWRNSIRKVYCA